MKDNYELMNTIQEVSLEELDQIIGAGKNGVFKTISHVCHMNSWQFLFTCCS
ncbi:lacticin 481 family lantibiotic [Streptococcus suis]|uniref:lacticin 481 family lantibiotic n=1 Tax=Streptococcus suis TaxID=1307 RepID=UPI0015840517|nr:lacticin 481 family lantibiotic [Streptococcus suis]